MQVEGDVVEQQRRDALVDPGEQPEERRRARPTAAPPTAPAARIKTRVMPPGSDSPSHRAHAGTDDAADDELALAADVHEPGPGRHGDGQAGEDERRRPHEDLAVAFGLSTIELTSASYALERIGALDRDHDAEDDEGADDREQHASRLDQRTLSLRASARGPALPPPAASASRPTSCSWRTRHDVRRPRRRFPKPWLRVRDPSPASGARPRSDRRSSGRPRRRSRRRAARRCGPTARRARRGPRR